jgi:hypothetical protein
MIKSKVLNEEDFDSLRYGDPEIGTVIEDNLFDSGRWVEYHSIVWSENHDGELLYFNYIYEMPATEQQEGSESEFDADGINQVFPQEVITIKYFTQKELDAKAAKGLTS